jgi:hypothetical protein
MRIARTVSVENGDVMMEMVSKCTTIRPRRRVKGSSKIDYQERDLKIRPSSITPATYLI